MWRSLASNFLTLMIVVLVILGGMIYWGQRVWVTPGPLAEGICVGVPRGATMSSMSQRLAEQGAIRDARIFRIGSDYTARSENLKAGNFLVPAGASMDSVSTLLTSSGQSTCGSEAIYRIGVTKSEIELREIDPTTGRYETVERFAPDASRPSAYQRFMDQGFGNFRVSMAEGATSYHVWESVEKLDILDGQVDLVPAEGTLAPGSYDIAPGDDRGELIAEMVERQTDILTEAWLSRADGVPLDDINQALTLASIVEKETGVAEERAQVASVFVNRLKQGMRLQTDPTVIYGITEGKRVLGRGLRASELRRFTPYNTYVIEGLPPGPIANPGKDAIEAALNPASTEYLFFVADGTGGHAFAKTLAEHNANVRKWREIERQQLLERQSGQ